MTLSVYTEHTQLGWLSVAGWTERVYTDFRALRDRWSVAAINRREVFFYLDVILYCRYNVYYRESTFAMCTSHMKTQLHNFLNDSCFRQGSIITKLILSTIPSRFVTKHFALEKYTKTLFHGFREFPRFQGDHLPESKARFHWWLRLRRALWLASPTESTSTNSLSSRNYPSTST